MRGLNIVGYDTSISGSLLPQPENSLSKTRRQCQDQGGDGLTRQQSIGQRKTNCGLGIALSFRYVRVMRSGVECECYVRSKHFALICRCWSQ